jgi:rod shape-determining protein MreB and related proteins
LFAGLSWQDMAIDLGTANTVIFLKGQGIVFSDPSIVAIDKETGEIVGVGSAAKDTGRTSDNIELIKPLQGGVVADFESTKEMLSYFIHKAQLQRRGFGSLLGPRMIVCVPSGITSVELWAIREIAESVGARRAYTIEEPLAAAIGAGLPVNKAQGSIMVSLGAGTSEAAVISLGGIVTKSSIRIAGDDMDYAISWHIQNEHEVAIDTKTAEQLKVKLGSALACQPVEKVVARGICAPDWV